MDFLDVNSEIVDENSPFATEETKYLCGMSLFIAYQSSSAYVCMDVEI